MASSSSAIDSYDNYDVFLSFRGDDTRYNFTSHLYDALCRSKIKAFIDYKIDRGDEITPALERVIDGAWISIIVFSKNYAESAFCLEELMRIMQCKQSKAQTVLPVFYKVDPSEVTYQKAFARHETNNSKGKSRRRGEAINQGMKKVERWKLAFRQALELAGWHIVKNSDEAEIIGKITKEVLEKLNNNRPKGEELMCTPMVGQTSKDNFKKILECLMNDKISRVGVYGMGGVGKTTIAAHINNQLIARANSFSLICWVTVSKDLSICNIQNNIANVINLDLSKEDDERKRAAKLKKELKTEKFVLILDDVWEAFEIEDVGIPPLVGGQKLFLTSRSRRVCERMECQPMEMKPLFEQEALDLFIKESKYQKNDSLEWGDVVTSIVEECAGLPLAIVVIARRMKGVEEIRNWRNTLRELQKPLEGENLEMEKKVFKVLKFSYDCLPNDKYRQCFLYCSLFPEGHLIGRDDLIEYWIGEELVDELDSRQAELDRGNAILDELIHSSLLEIHSKWIKMHDVIRDMAHIIVKVRLQFQDSFESVQVLKKTMIKSFPNSVPYCSKLKTLEWQGYDIKELPGFFFSNIHSLIILHMKFVTSIPDSITNLRNLRVLIINHCYTLECIPSLVGLEKLRYLEISWNFWLKETPKGIEGLFNLRVLDLSWNNSLGGSFPSCLVENLSHLQTLNLIASRVEVEPEALISLENLEILMVKFFNLHNLNCYIKSGHWRRLMNYQINYGEYDSGNLKKGLSLDAISYFENWEDESGIFLPDNIQELQLVNWESPMFYVLKNLTFFDLRIIRNIKYKSRYLFTVDSAQHLFYNVQELSIDDCYELDEIIAAEEEKVNQNNCINYPTIELPNLKILTLFFLPKLRSIYRGKIVCPSLELIQMSGCDKLERLPFCMKKERRKQNPTIKVRGWHEEDPVSRRWWESLQWDDPSAKSIYHPIFTKSFWEMN